MNLIEFKTKRAPNAAPDENTALLRLDDVRKNYVTDGQVVHAVDGVIAGGQSR